jgi:molecular chaperone GrpE (heat shock protein)
MPEELSESSRAQGVTLVYTKINSQLEWLNIVAINPEAWIEPDLMYHIPISSQPVEDKKQQWKIVTVIETWFLYKKDDAEKVIIPAKVIVGA